jgi:isopentenyldiphosphate isomerase
MSEAAQDPNELFDVVRADGKPTGRVKIRADVHRDGDWHRAVHIWIAGIDGATPFVLVQRRSLEKDTCPGYLDVAVGGHLGAGEGLTEGLREVEEEIGVAVREDELRWLGTRRGVRETPEDGIMDRELQEVFWWRRDDTLDRYRPNPAELSELVKLPLASLLDLLSGGTPVIAGERLIATSLAIEPAHVVFDDFVPTLDRYMYRAAIAIRHALRGEKHVAV